MSIQINLPSIHEANETEVIIVPIGDLPPLKVDLARDVQILTLTDDDQKALPTETNAHKEVAPF